MSEQTALEQHLKDMDYCSVSARTESFIAGQRAMLAHVRDVLTPELEDCCNMRMLELRFDELAEEVKP